MNDNYVNDYTSCIRQIVSVVRKQLKEQKFFRFEELLIAFENEDKKCEGKVHADDIRKVSAWQNEQKSSR